jgi:G3E family GTPase
VLLGNSCVCCTTRTDLQNALRRLLAERERGTIPEFHRIVIETSGLADPGPILQTFATDRALGDSFHVEVLAAVVDAATGAATLEWSSEARKQAILADTLVVTKTDLAAAAETQTLIGQLRALNPRAAIVTVANGVLDPLCLIESAASEHTAFVAEAEHSDGIRSFVLTANAPILWPMFARAMDTLAALRGADLLRVKGFLDVEGCKGPVLVQFVQHLAHPPVELDRWDGERGSRVVFITRNLPEARITDLFAAVKALA